MNTNSLLNTEKRKSDLWKKLLIALGIILVFSAGGFGIWKYINETERADQFAREERQAEEKMRDAIVFLLAQPRFSGDQFARQMIGVARLQRFAVRRKEVYFSLPESDRREFEKKIGFVVDPKKLEMGKERDGRIYLSPYSLLKTPETGYFFKTTLDNLQFKTGKELKFQFTNATYTLRLQELIDFSENSTIYGGRLTAASHKQTGGGRFVFANHGIMVAKPGEPSLNRFIEDLLKKVPNSEKREVKIQTLLDFVTKEIEYDYAEALGSYETLKRPNEVLMSRKSDCSNKTILMASFLEQIGEDYLLLYSPGHITVAVPKGEFPNENGLEYEWDGKPWVIAETTLPDFQIGRTRVKETVNLKTVRYVQKPRQTNIIFDAGNFMPLEFF